MTKEALFYPHLGLGDFLINNALVRELAKTQRVTVLCKHHNVETARFQWRDSNNIEVFGLSGDVEAIAACEMIEKNERRVIRQGMHRNPKYIVAPGWDEGFYTEMKLDPSLRWSGFKVDRQPSRELGLKITKKVAQPVFGGEIPKVPYAFVHDDSARGCNIKNELLPKKMPIVWSTPIAQNGESNLFDWWGVIMGATEIHVMESCMAILVDMSPELAAKKKCLHLYTRKSVPPKFNLKWSEIYE